MALGALVCLIQRQAGASTAGAGGLGHESGDRGRSMQQVRAL